MVIASSLYAISAYKSFHRNALLLSDGEGTFKCWLRELPHKPCQSKLTCKILEGLNDMCYTSIP